MVKFRFFHIEVRSAADFFCYDGLLSIGKVEISIRIFLSLWKLQDFLNQWEEGVKRIKDHNVSCLIHCFDEAEIIDGERYSPRLYWIVLYKKDDKVIIQKLRFPEDIYDQYIGTNVIITKENCYDYIPKYNQYYPIAVDYPYVFWELSEEDFDKKFSIKITDENIDLSWYCPVVSGAITIGDYVDEFKVGVSVWSVDDYKQQWKEAIEQLQNNSSTCLMTDVSESKGDVGRWLLYKRDGKIVFYHASFRGVSYQENIGEEVLTKENCYDFIPDEQSHLEKYRVKEWEVDLKEFDGLEVIWPEK